MRIKIIDGEREFVEGCIKRRKETMEKIYKEGIQSGRHTWQYIEAKKELEILLKKRWSQKAQDFEVKIHEENEKIEEFLVEMKHNLNKLKNHTEKDDYNDELFEELEKSIERIGKIVNNNEDED